MILQILNELAADNSRLHKEAVLKREQKNDVLKEFFRLSLDSMIQFYQRKIPEYTPNTRDDWLPLSDAMNKLSVLSERDKTGNAAIEYLKDLLEKVGPDDAQVIERIIKKDPMCGVAESTVNKTWKGLIFEFPCMLASKHEQKLIDKLDWENGVFVQLKSDGMRVMAICHEDGTVELRSRNGKLIEHGGRFDSLGSHFSGYVLDGELLVRGSDGRTLDRKTGNGICTKALRGTAKDSDLDSLFIAVWDMIPLKDFYKGKGKETYEFRFGKLKLMLAEKDVPLKIIPSEFCFSYEDAVELYRFYVEEGQEGVILKDRNMIWENKRSKGQIKMKEELDADLLIVGTKEHSKKAGWIGSLILESADGLVKVDCGSGLNDEMRQRDPSEFIGKVAAIKYNALIQDKVKGDYSMFLPILLEIRLDKAEADTLEKLK